MNSAIEDIDKNQEESSSKAVKPVQKKKTSIPNKMTPSSSQSSSFHPGKESKEILKLKAELKEKTKKIENLQNYIFKLQKDINDKMKNSNKSYKTLIKSNLSSSATLKSNHEISKEEDTLNSLIQKYQTNSREVMYDIEELGIFA